jgi:queuine/archaeosine tRNA-ribosyltransferase
MNNQELNAKLQQLIKIDNYCDYIIAVKEFSPEYKKTEFYKLTKKPLEKALNEMKLHNLINMKSMIKRIQELIDGLNFDNVQQLIEDFSNMYAQENADVQNILTNFVDNVTNDKN